MGKSGNIAAVANAVMLLFLALALTVLPGTGSAPAEGTAGLAVGAMENVNLHDEARPAVPIRFADGEGAERSLAEFRGKVVLLNFWATWCTPCREEMPMLQALQRQYGDRGFQVIGIALDDVERVSSFISELGIEYPNMVGAADVALTGVIYGNSSGTLPYSVLIDREGIIRWRKHGEIKPDTFSQRLEQLL